MDEYVHWSQPSVTYTVSVTAGLLSQTAGAVPTGDTGELAAGTVGAGAAGVLAADGAEYAGALAGAVAAEWALLWTGDTSAELAAEEYAAGEIGTEL